MWLGTWGAQPGRGKPDVSGDAAEHGPSASPASTIVSLANARAALPNRP